jgi:DNA invertase Pin-like site-specific DNA recombinase
MNTPPVAYSYIRFSSPSQAEGDSLRRQTEAALDWCKRHKVRLDTSTTLHDLGKSAYTGKHRTNADRHALAAFLKLVEQGRVPRGSFLIVESLDRLSREHIRPALTLLLGLIEDGVKIVQLLPVEVVYDETVEPMQLMMALMELSRGNSESRVKSERVGKAWAEKKERARKGQAQEPSKHMQEGDMFLTRQLPAWVEVRGGKPVLIPKKAAAVKRVLELAASGYGIQAIIQRLDEEKVEPIGKSGRWTHAYVGLLLRDRRVTGELQPRKRNGTPDGDVVPGYFPAAVTEEEWLAARAGVDQRYLKRGGSRGHFNFFSSLLWDARSQTSYVATTAPARNNGDRRILINTDSKEGRAPLRSFPLPIFEKAVLSCLHEIDPHKILNGDTGPDETQILAGELARVDSAIAAIVADLDAHGESATQHARLRAKEAEKKDLAEKLAAARQKAAHPLSESWGECQSLIDTLDNAPDPNDARLRLRAALRHIVDSIWLLVVVRGYTRLVAVQIWFAGCKRRRDYLIYYRRGGGNAKSRTPGDWDCWSLSRFVTADSLDIRIPDDARALEEELMEIDLDDLAEGAAG